MAYATQSDFSDRYGASFLIDVADYDDDDSADTSAVTEALDDGASEMDSYIGRNYSLPLDSSPDWFVRCNVDLAAYHLASESRGRLTEEIIAKYDRWIARLEKIATGVLALGLASEPSSHYEDALSSDDPVFNVSQTAGLF
jgi:phage gp36-like protein